MTLPQLLEHIELIHVVFIEPFRRKSQTELRLHLIIAKCGIKGAVTSALVGNKEEFEPRIVTTM